MKIHVILLPPYIDAFKLKPRPMSIKSYLSVDGAITYIHNKLKQQFEVDNVALNVFKKYKKSKNIHALLDIYNKYNPAISYIEIDLESLK